MIQNKSIGVFDSGLGGLTVVKELKKILPDENIVYFGDTARIPYGGKSKETVYRYAKNDIDFLLSKNVKAIVVACGTASSVVDEEMKKNILVPIITVIPPAIDSAMKLSKNKNIGVIATASTVRSNSYINEFKKKEKKDLPYKIYSKACPMFVPLVENGYFHKDNKVARLIATEYLSFFSDKDIDTLILGCTHYPLLYDLIKSIMKKNISLIDSGKETAIIVKKLLEEEKLLRTDGNVGLVEYFVSDAPIDFKEQAEIFLGEDINTEVTKVDIEKLYEKK